MSVQTAMLAHEAEGYLASARAGRANDDRVGPPYAASLCLQRAAQCIAAADERRPDDANDVRRARTAASQAEDFVGPAGMRGGLPGPQSDALSTLNAAMVRLERLGSGRGSGTRWEGRREDVRLASTTGGFRSAPRQRSAEGRR